ncbi:MAG: DUF4124 domain-containing protein [Pseudomonadales bacterium]
MKLGYKLMLFALVALFALPMFMVKPDGKPMMTLSDWIPDTEAINEVGTKLRNMASDAPSLDNVSVTTKSKMYSWKDDRGVMHFSEDPPPEDSSALQLKVRDMPKEVNLMNAVKPRQPSKASGGAGGGESAFKLAFPATVPLKEIPKLIDNAKALQQLADQRGAALNDL